MDGGARGSQARSPGLHGDSWQQSSIMGTDTRCWSACAVHVRMGAPAPPFSLPLRLTRERPTAVLPGPVTILYEIREELTLGRNCERSLPNV